MHIFHTFYDNFHDSLEVSKVAHSADSVTLDENVAISQQLESLESLTIGPDQTLSTLDKLLFVANEATNFDYFSKHTVILDDLDCLLEWN